MMRISLPGLTNRTWPDQESARQAGAAFWQRQSDGSGGSGVVALVLVRDRLRRYAVRAGPAWTSQRMALRPGDVPLRYWRPRRSATNYTPIDDSVVGGMSYQRYYSGLSRGTGSVSVERVPRDPSQAPRPSSRPRRWSPVRAMMRALAEGPLTEAEATDRVFRGNTCFARRVLRLMNRKGQVVVAGGVYKPGPRGEAYTAAVVASIQRGSHSMPINWLPKWCVVAGGLLHESLPHHNGSIWNSLLRLVDDPAVAVAKAVVVAAGLVNDDVPSAGTP